MKVWVLADSASRAWPPVSYMPSKVTSISEEERKEVFFFFQCRHPGKIVRESSNSKFILRVRRSMKPDLWAKAQPYSLRQASVPHWSIVLTKEKNNPEKQSGDSVGHIRKNSTQG